MRLSTDCFLFPFVPSTPHFACSQPQYLIFTPRSQLGCQNTQVARRQPKCPNKTSQAHRQDPYSPSDTTTDMTDQNPETGDVGASGGPADSVLRRNPFLETYESTKRIVNSMTTVQSTATTPINEEWVMLDAESDDDAPVVVKGTKKEPKAAAPLETNESFQQDPVIGAAQRTNETTLPTRESAAIDAFETERALTEKIRHLEKMLRDCNTKPGDTELKRDIEANLAAYRRTFQRYIQARQARSDLMMGNLKVTSPTTGPSWARNPPPAAAAVTKASPEAKTDKQPGGVAGVDPDDTRSRVRGMRQVLAAWPALADPAYPHDEPRYPRVATRASIDEDIYNSSPPRSRRPPVRDSAN
ncbi:hypothetical protein B0T22DRAFT_460221 [Podospora appendiculata]|uniref:Uncharacterized protein n=1 Tax=Podospora appendiculata TaxID=314037 RepID=A0AAE0XAD9_9PEZI|nr:hypothetical protein B0T22DRAFT_460221 [Podospora appendiculata]